MEVIINQKNFLLNSSSLIEALQLYGLSLKKGIAIAVNNRVIPKSSWESYKLQPSDQITVITAAQGG